MIVACPSCQSRFQYDEARFQGAPSKRFRCPRCSHVFEAANPSLAVPIVEPEIPALPEPAVTAPRPAQAPTAVFDAEQLRAKLGLAPFEPVPQVPQPSPGSARETTARRGRNAMLHAAGLAGGMPRGMRFTLAFLSGARASTVRVLDSTMTIIGREEGEIVTGDPETSRRHAQIEIHEDGTAWLSDLGSTNGTYVDGVLTRDTVQLHDRTEFSCGKSSFMLLIRSEDSNSMD